MKSWLGGSLLWTAGLCLLALVVPAAALAGASTGDGVWKWQNPLPQGNSVNGAWFGDALHGWLVGDYGTLIHTTDGGATWSGQDSTTVLDLNAVYFADGQHGWAVGGGYNAETKSPPLPANIIATSDGGANWHGQPLWVADDTFINSNLIRNTDLYDVRFTDARHGWTVGQVYEMKDFKYHGLLLSTDDGGRSWTRDCANVITGAILRDVVFTDAQHGWIVGDDILTTSDAGATWTRVDGSGSAIAFSDPLHGWLGGAGGSLKRTDDAGDTWRAVSLPSGQEVRDVFSADAGRAVVMTVDGTVLCTEDGGDTWTSQSLAADGVQLTTMCFGDAAAGWVLGDSAYSTYVRQSTDGGATWTPPPSYVTADLKATSFVSRTRGWAVGADGTIMTTGDGEAWTTQVAPVSAQLNDVDFDDALTGWAAGAAGTVVTTTDGGTTWRQEPTGVVNDLDTVSFVDAQHGWVAGDDIVLRTTDGGLSWTPTHVGSGEWATSVESLSFVDAQHGWAAGVLPSKVTLNGPRGCVWKTSDGGATWTRQYVHDYLSMHAVCFTDLQHGWVTGDQKQIYRTSDGGATWHQCTIITEWADDTSMHDIMLTDRTHGWAVGTKGYILATSDGEHWVEENSGTTRVLEGVSFVDEGHGWVVGAGGIILEDPGPLCRAPYKSTVRRGRTATLKYLVSDAAAVKVHATIIIRNSRGRRSKKLEQYGKAPNRIQKATFLCTLPRGTYHFYVYAKDSAGNKAAVPAVNKLIVR